MSEFTHEDLEWLEEHGFEKKREKLYQFKSQGEFKITIWALEDGCWCQIQLDSDSEIYAHTAATLKDAIKKAVSKLQDAHAKRSNSINFITRITSKFVCGYEKGVTTPSVKQFIESLSIDELRYIVTKFSEWYNDEGCPYVQHDFKCDFYNEEEFAEDADRGNCPYEEYTNACWVKYFLEQYRLEKHEK
jgi:hypothetical protein